MNKRILCIVVMSLLLVTGASLSAGEKSLKNNGKLTKKVLNSSNEQKNALTWVSYDEGLEIARQEGKKVFVEFTTDWCGWCKKMHATTFKDPEVIKFLNTYYVTISVNGDSRDSLNVDGFMTTEKGVTRDYGVRSYPTYWFLESDGEKITLLKGYKDNVFLTNALDYIKEPNIKEMTFEEFMTRKAEMEKKAELEKEKEN